MNKRSERNTEQQYFRQNTVPIQRGAFLTEHSRRRKQ